MTRPPAQLPAQARREDVPCAADAKVRLQHDAGHEDPDEEHDHVGGDVPERRRRLLTAPRAACHEREHDRDGQDGEIPAPDLQGPVPRNVRISQPPRLERPGVEGQHDEDTDDQRKQDADGRDPAPRFAEWRDRIHPTTIPGLALPSALWFRRVTMTSRFVAALGVLLVLGAAAHAADFTLRLPLGLQEQAAYVPADNPLTADKIALGKQFFWDTRWSRNGTIACVSCHDPNHGWADPRPVSLRFDGKPTPRHSPTLVNRLFSDTQQWAGTRTSLEDQALKASDQSPELLVKNLGAIAGYQRQFQKVFGTGVTPD